MTIQGWKTSGMFGWHFVRQVDGKITKKFCPAWDNLKSNTPIATVPYDRLKYRNDVFCTKCLEEIRKEGID